MRSMPNNWIGLFTKLGFKRRKQTKGRNTNNFSRRLRMESLEDRRVLAVITVDTPIDENDGNITTDGDVSLRDAVEQAISGDTIDFDPAIMNGETIKLLASEGGEGTEIAFANKTLTIDASMLSQGLTIDAGGGTNGTVGNGDGFRIFNITGTGLVTLDSLTLTGADVTEGNGAGGAIRTTASLTVRNSTIDNNHASSGGGGVAIVSTNASDIFLFTNTTFTNNTTGFQGNGGGLSAELSGGSLTIEDSTFEINATDDGANGGGLSAVLEGGSLTIEDSTFDNNTAEDSGGGIASSAFTPYVMAA